MTTPPPLDCLCRECEREARAAAQRPAQRPAAPLRPDHPPVVRRRRGERLTVACDCRRCEAAPCPCRLCVTNRQAAAAAVGRREVPA